MVPVDLDDECIGNKLHCLKGAWLATLGTARVSLDSGCHFHVCLGGGATGARRQLIEGRGVVFLVGGGTVLRRDMGRRERLVLDDHALLAWSGTVGFASRSSRSSSGDDNGDGGLGGLLKGAGDACCTWTGEGAFKFTVTGGAKGGVIFIQSMPFAKFRRAILI